MNKAIFLDRDGTLVKDKGYLKTPNEVELLPSIDVALNKFSLNKFNLIVVSNQSGIGRGYYNIAEMKKVNDRIKSELLKHSITILAFYYCPHFIGSKIDKYNIKCDCRKPSPGLIIQAAKDHNIDLCQSYMIGDKESDIIAGLRAGVKKCYLIDENHDLLFYANLICK